MHAQNDAGKAVHEEIHGGPANNLFPVPLTDKEDVSDGCIDLGGSAGTAEEGFCLFNRCPAS